MSSKKTLDERLEDLRKKQEQLKAQERMLKAKQAQAERKARTKRLIEIGGAVESVLGAPILKEDLPKLLNFLKEQEERGLYFSKAMGVIEKETTREIAPSCLKE